MLTDESLHKIARIAGPEGILTGDAVSSRSAGWGHSENIAARAILRPKSTTEISQIMALCHAENQPVVVHGGLTGLVQGAMTASHEIVLSLERMNKIEEIDPINRTMTVQAGVILQHIHEAVDEVNLMFPLDLGARGTCMIGGNIATNAGGVRVIRYGMTRDLVLGLEAVLADGTVVTSLNKMLKNNAGYDLKQLFIGSEGTLGIVTRAVLRLLEKPVSHNTGFVALNSFEQVTKFLKWMNSELGGNLSAFEVMWQDFYRLVTTAPAYNAPPLPYEFPFYVITDSLGTNQKDDAAAFEAALAGALEQQLIADAVIAKSQRESEAIWAMRHDVEQMQRNGPVLGFDVSLPINEMNDYTRSIQKQIEAQWPDGDCFIFGHLGDSNLHIVVSPGTVDKDMRHKIEEIIYLPLQKIRGSISAEHGIGIEKKPYLGISRTKQEIHLMQTLKRSLDPRNILNPDRIFDF